MNTIHYIGRPCKNGHTIRFISNKVCVQCNLDEGRARRRTKAEERNDSGSAVTRKVGKICSKHPELGGERLLSNSACPSCKVERQSKWMKDSNHVFEHYGHQCARCGEDDPDVLTIDHIAQDGSKHLSPSGRRYSGVHLYKWLRTNGYPHGFRTLCVSCNVKVFKLFKRGESE